MTTQIDLSGIIPIEYANLRLDQALSKLFPDYSRANLQKWLAAGEILVDGKTLRARDKVHGGESIALSTTLVVQTTWQPQALALDIIYADEDILVINKPRNLVVHPGAGNPSGTLLNALLHFDSNLALLPRVGIVHRLDKDTSGLLVIARTLEAQHHLVQQLQTRSMHREYIAIVKGTLTGGGKIDEAISRHPHKRTQMAVWENGKPAITHYRLLEKFVAHTALTVQLETGRTHQIRVHMAHIRHPIIGDTLYGGRLSLPKNASPQLIATLQKLSHQALHAHRLSLIHPRHQTIMSWEAPIPADMQRLLELLREHKHEFSSHS